jgi:4-amino-4-deoxy-L-arabinose transferase-like glycosyltransferase
MNVDTSTRGTKIWQHPHLWQWLMVALLLLSFGLRLHRTGERAVWWDEGWSVWVARQSLADIAYQTGHDVHPPVYFWLLHLWHEGTGDTEFALRAFSGVLGTLAIAAVYLLGRTAANSQTGFLAALFLTVSRFHIIWSQEIRMYALAGLLAVLGAWAAIRFWDSGKPGYYTLYILCIIGGLLTLYLFFPVPLAINIAFLWVLWHAKNRGRTLLIWGAAQAAILVVVGLWLSYALAGFLSTSSATPIGVWDFLQIYWTVLVTGIPLDVAAYARYTLPVLAVFITAVITLIIQSRKNWRMGRNVVLFMSGMLVPLAVVVYVTIPKLGSYAPPFAPRYLVIFTGYYSVLLAWGIMRLGAGRRWPVAVVLSGVVLFVSLVGMRGYYSGRVLIDDYKSLADTLTAYAQPGDAVVLHSDRDWPIFDYHADTTWIGVPHLWEVDGETAVSFLQPIWQDPDGIWLALTPYANVTDPSGTIPAWLDEQAIATLDYTYGDKALRFYARTPERAAQLGEMAPTAKPQFAAAVTVKPGINFVGYDLPSRTYHSGDTLRMALYFSRDGAKADENLALEVGLKDQNGQAVQWSTVSLALADQPSDANLIRKEVVFQLPPDTDTGDYAFYLFNCGACEQFAQVHIKQRFQEFVAVGDVEIAHPMNSAFANGIRLLGYDIAEETIAPGEPVRLRLFWQTTAPVDAQFKVFTHLLGDVFNAETENFLWGQQDNEPVNNKRPTTTWRPGEIIVDAYAMPTALNAPAGSYTLEIGLYNPVTGERLLVVDDGTVIADHIILDSWVIIKNEGN